MNSIREKEWLQSSPNLLWTGLYLGLGYWLIESILHIVLYRDIGIISQFFPYEIHELINRLLFWALICGFGFYAHLQSNARNRLAKTASDTENGYWSVIETLSNPVLLLNENGKIVECNRSALDFFECPAGQITTINLLNCLTGFSRSEALCKWPVEPSGPLELEWSFNGVSKRLLLWTVPYGDSDAALFFGIGIDATEMRKARPELKHQYTPLRPGEPAICVAHEIINPINGIINYAQMLRNGNGKDERVTEIACRIEQEGERVAAIAESCLSPGNPGKQPKAPVQIEGVLEKTLALLEFTLQKDDIILQVDAAPELPPVYAASSEIQQVFTNLLVNARDALNSKSSPIKSKTDKKIKITARTLSNRHGTIVRVSFLDHGTGISKNHIDNVSMPFFTTKPPGRGTGLGLSISRDIVADHGGNMRINSVEGKSTEIIIDFPAVSEGESL